MCSKFRAGKATPWRGFTTIILFLLTLLLSAAPISAATYSRVVSLAPNITEMIYLLGADNVLVGITDDCNYPPSANSKKSTGPFGNPDLEKIVALQPDLVLYTEVKDPGFADKMKSLNITAIPVVVEHFADLQRQMQKVGDLLGQKFQAKDIVRQWEMRLRAVHMRAKGQRKVRVYFELWDKPRITAGSGSFINELILLAGGTNIAGTFARPYPKPSEEFVISTDPELIVLGYQVSENVKFPDSWREVTAVKNGLVVSSIDLDLLLRPGPRLLDGLERLQREIEHARTVLDTPATTGKVKK